MLRPKTTAKTSTGTTTKIAAVAPVRPSARTPTPCWNTRTIRPKAALTDSEFMMTALTGTSRERNATASISPVTPSTSPMIHGKRPSRFSWQSTPAVPAQIRVEQVGVLGPRGIQVRIEQGIAEERLARLEIHYAADFADPRIGPQGVGQSAEAAEPGQLSDLLALGELDQHPHRKEVAGEPHPGQHIDSRSEERRVGK